jgi:hypothetical protein
MTRRRVILEGGRRGRPARGPSFVAPRLRMTSWLRPVGEKPSLAATEKPCGHRLPGWKRAHGAWRAVSAPASPLPAAAHCTCDAHLPRPHIVPVLLWRAGPHTVRLSPAPAVGAGGPRRPGPAPERCSRLVARCRCAEVWCRAHLIPSAPRAPASRRSPADRPTVPCSSGLPRPFRGSCNATLTECRPASPRSDSMD